MKLHTARWTPLLLLSCGLLSGCGPKPPKPVWNLPELIGQPIDMVKQKLGQPQSETDAGSDVKQSTWQSEGATLVANWKTGNRRVKEWTVTSRDNSNALREEEQKQLLVTGQVKEGDPKYTVDYIEAPERPLYYTGVHIVPALKNHSVILRLSGSVSLVEVSHTGSGAPDTFQTMPPWEQTFTLPDDSLVTFSAVVRKAIIAGPTDIKVEIVSDGKVVASAASQGEYVQCKTEL